MHTTAHDIDAMWPRVHTPARMFPGDARPSFALRAASRKLRIGNREIKLTQNELSFVRLLRRHGGRAVSRAIACENVWGRCGESYNRRLEVLVKRLRDKLGVDHELIQTVHGSGYRLRAHGAPHAWQVPSTEKHS
jgi:DNA-binding response OmpR family regulator